MSIKQNDQTYIAPTYQRYDVAFTRGEGSLLWDEKGKEYIDFGSGIAVNIFGIGDPEWVQAVSNQAERLAHVSNLYYSEPQTELARLLCQKAGMKKVFFGNSGAEANECAIKVARKWSNDTYGGLRQKIVTLKNSFHGRTVTTLSATGQAAFHQDFGPFTSGFVYAEPNDIDNLKRIFREHDVCTFLFEPIQGESGVHKLDTAYVQEVAALCQEEGVLLMADEVQTGNGRTGTLFAVEQFGVKPDVITTAKGLGGGLPIGACLLGERVERVLVYGSHGSTFGGNPVCAAGAKSIIERIDDRLLSGVRERSAYIVRALTGAEGVNGIDGMGLMLGISVQKPARAVVEACLHEGLAVLTAKNNVRLLPALNIPMPLLEKGIAILKKVIAP